MLSLTGRIGAGHYFKIGDSYSGTAATSGNLFLAFVDNDSSNNTGFVTASVAAAVPERETYALMLAGLGLVGAVGRRRRKT